MSKLRNILLSGFIIVFLCGFKFNGVEYPLPDYSQNSAAWHARNDALIPGEEEQKAIMELAAANGVVFNLQSDDYDGDGVPNQYDPSPYDWRETGYDPFAVLAFLNWSHDWNSYAYQGDKLDQAVAVMAKSGIPFVRMDFSWEDIQPSEGEWQFDKYDRIVKLLTDNNIRILGIVSYSATWASSNKDHLWNYPPKDDKYFTDYAVAVISRYKNKVKYWEVWNEPDSRSYWVPQDMLVGYTQILKETYAVAKRTDPSCKIVLGGLADAWKIDWIYKNGGKDYFDVANIHILISPLNDAPLSVVKSSINQVRKTMVRFGDGEKSIWITELGCPGVPKKMKSLRWFAGMSPNEKQQAEWLGQVYREIPKEPLVDKVFWAFFRDSGGYFKNGVDYFGLIRWDFSEKPSMLEYEKVIKSWQGLK